MGSMKAIIHSPAKTAMQSGQANTGDWLLEFEAEKPRTTDALMGWTGSSDMAQEIKLRFASREEAEDYARKHDIPYEVLAPRRRKTIIKSYADNFK